MRNSSIFLAATLAAGIGLTALPPSADAGGHERWRSCGGHAYEGCDGRGHGPYARSYRGGGGYHGGYAAPCGRCENRQGRTRRDINIEVEAWYKRTPVLTEVPWRRVNGVCEYGPCPPPRW